MVAGPGSCPVVGSGVLDEVVVMGVGYSIVSGVGKMDIGEGRDTIWHRLYWPLSFHKLVDAVDCMAAKADKET